MKSKKEIVNYHGACSRGTREEKCSTAGSPGSGDAIVGGRRRMVAWRWRGGQAGEGSVPPASNRRRMDGEMDRRSGKGGGHRMHLAAPAHAHHRAHTASTRTHGHPAHAPHGTQPHHASRARARDAASLGFASPECSSLPRYSQCPTCSGCRMRCTACAARRPASQPLWRGHRVAPTTRPRLPPAALPRRRIVATGLADDAMLSPPWPSWTAGPT